MKKLIKCSITRGKIVSLETRVFLNLYNQKQSRTIKGLREDSLIIKSQFFAQICSILWN